MPTESDRSAQLHSAEPPVAEPPVADPAEEDPSQAERRRAAHQAAVTAVLEAAACSMFVDLVLHGSTLMQLWFGEAAREPTAVDFILAGGYWPDDGTAMRLAIDGIALTAGDASRHDGLAVIDPHTMPSGGIRKPDGTGRHLLLPWSAERCPPGVLQVTFTTVETLAEPAEPIAVPTVTGYSATVAAVSRGLSLAWKLRDLVTAGQPRIEDLYDAVLLAESMRLHPRALPDIQADRPPTLATVGRAASHLDEALTERLRKALAPSLLTN